MSRFIVEKEFMHKGLKCVVLFGNSGTRNGYVGITEDHPYYGKDYHEVDHLEVHGGLTYSSNGSKLYPVESDLHWFGFDCAHWGDGNDMDKAIEYFPEQKESLILMRHYDEGDAPKSLEYVENECKKLAEQLRGVK